MNLYKERVTMQENFQQPPTTPNVPQAFVCPKCHTTFSGQTFCPNCGKQVKLERCKKCGFILEDDKDFCPHCGKKRKKNIVPIVFLVIGIFLAFPTIAFGNMLLLVCSLIMNAIALFLTLKNQKKCAKHKALTIVLVSVMALTALGCTITNFTSASEKKLIEKCEQICVADNVEDYQKHILESKKISEEEKLQCIFKNDSTKIFEYLLSTGVTIPSQIEGEDLFEFGYKKGYRIPMEYAIKTENIDVNQTRDGKPLLLNAMERRSPAAISVLIQAGANTDIRTAAGLTLLEEACYQGWDKSIIALLENGISPLPEKNNGTNLIQLYVKQGNFMVTNGEGGHESDATVAKLLEYGCPVSLVPYGRSYTISLTELALEQNAYITLQQLITQGVDMNDINLIRYHLGPTISDLESEESDKLKTLEVFLTSNFDISNRDEDGNTIFTLFAETAAGSSESIEFYRGVVDMLLKKGCNIEEKNNKGETALFIAATSVGYRALPGGGYSTKDYTVSPENTQKYIEVLLEYGADVNAKNNEGQTAVAKGLVPGMIGFMENKGCRG